MDSVPQKRCQNEHESYGPSPSFRKSGRYDSLHGLRLPDSAGTLFYRLFLKSKLESPHKHDHTLAHRMASCPATDNSYGIVITRHRPKFECRQT